jgi:hypothetical protein
MSFTESSATGAPVAGSGWPAASALDDGQRAQLRLGGRQLQRQHGQQVG